MVHQLTTSWWYLWFKYKNCQTVRSIKQAKDFTQKIKDKKLKNTKVKGDPLLGNFDYDEPVKKSVPKSTPKTPKKPNVFKKVKQQLQVKRLQTQRNW